MRAEGALRGWDMGGSARDFYEQGVKLSFDQRKVGGAEEYLANAVAVPEPFVDPTNPVKCNYTPKTKITIAWNEGAPTEEKLERIITQKWIANFLWALKVGPIIGVQVIRKCFHLSAI